MCYINVQSGEMHGIFKKKKASKNMKKYFYYWLSII